MTCCSIGREMAGEPALAERLGAPLRPHPRRRIPGHQPASGVHPARPEARRRGSDGGRRRRAIDLLLPRGGVRNILDFPAQFPAPAEVVTLDRNYRSTDAILAAANAVIGEAAERFTKNLWTERRSAGEAAARHGARRSGPGELCLRPGAGRARGRNRAEGAGGAVPRLPPAARWRSSLPAATSLRQIRRPEIPRCGPCQGRAGGPAFRREPARPRGRFSRAAAFARHRPVDRRERSSRQWRRRWTPCSACLRSACRSEPKPTGLRFVDLFAGLRSKSAWPADLERVQAVV